MQLAQDSALLSKSHSVCAFTADSLCMDMATFGATVFAVPPSLHYASVLDVRALDGHGWPLATAVHGVPGRRSICAICAGMDIYLHVQVAPVVCDEEGPRPTDDVRLALPIDAGDASAVAAADSHSRPGHGWENDTAALSAVLAD